MDRNIDGIGEREALGGTLGESVVRRWRKRLLRRKPRTTLGRLTVLRRR